MRDEPLVLGIETSCDETGVGIVRGETLLVDAIASSVDEHGLAPDDPHPGLVARRLDPQHQWLVTHRGPRSGSRASA